MNSNTSSPPSQPIASDVVAAPDALSRHGSVEAESHRSPRNAQGWRPMETAPKSGTFLVYMPEERRKVQVMIQHPNVSVIGSVFAFDLSKPTHWMPLPDPPAAALANTESTEG